MDAIKLIEEPFLKDTLPNFEIGDNVDVHVRIVEGERTRTQVFSGTVIAKKGSGINSMFTVRRIVAGEGVERVFPIHSPVITAVKVTRRGLVRRAKLYYLRDRVGKATKVKEKIGALDAETIKEKKVKKRGKKARAEKDAKKGAGEDAKRDQARKERKAKRKKARKAKKGQAPAQPQA